METLIRRRRSWLERRRRACWASRVIAAWGASAQATVSLPILPPLMHTHFDLLLLHRRQPRPYVQVLDHAINALRSGGHEYLAAGTRVLFQKKQCPKRSVSCQGMTMGECIRKQANSSRATDNAVTTEGARLLVAYLDEYAKSS